MQENEDGTIKCKLFTCDEPNVNGHVYHRDTLKKAIDKYMQKEHRYCSMEPGEPTYLGSPILDEVSHEVKDLYIEGDIVYADVKILDTNQGKLLKSLLGSSTPFSAGHGILNDDKSITDYELTNVCFEVKGPWDK